jgi:flagellin
MTAGSTYTIASTTTNVGTINLVATGVAATDAANFAAAYNALGTTQFTAAGAVLTSSVGTSTLAVTAVRTAAQVAAGVTAAQASVAATGAIATADATAFGVLSAGTLGKQAGNGAAYSGQQIALAINTALASATGGAAVNGTATSNAAGQVSYVAGTTNSLTLTSGLVATSATAATANQTTLIAQTGFSAGQLGLQAAGTNTTNHGTITLSSTSADGIVYGGAHADNAGLLAAGATVLATTTSSVSSLASLNVLTAENATKALAAIDGALSTVNASRASLGAYQNRFTSVVTSLQTTSENLSAARSRIQDADFALETANLSRAQVLQQAGTAMVAQANQLPQSVLSLLK